LAAGLLTATLVTWAAVEARPESKERPRADRHGDALPEGALARLGTLNWRHGSPLTYLAFLPDGKGVLTASQDSILRLWDRDSGKEIRRFGKTPGDANAPGQAQMMGRFYGVGSTSVALSPDGKTLAVTNGASIQLWEVATGKELPGLKGPQNGVFTITFSPDSKTLAGRGGDQVIYLWDTSTAKEIRQIKNKPPENRPGVVFINVWGGSSPSLAFSPDGKTLASGETEFEQRKVSASIKLSEVETGKEIRRIPCEQNNVSGVAYSPDGKVLAYANGTLIRLCEPTSGKEIRQLKAAPGTSVLVFAPDSKTLASRGPGSDTISLWEVETGKEVRQLGEQSEIANANLQVQFGFGGMGGSGRDLAFSPDGKILAAGRKHSVCFYETATGKEVAQDKGHRGPITAVLLAADGKTALSAGSDNLICRWNAATGKELNSFQAPAGTTCVALAADGRTVALGNRDNTVRLHETASGKELHKLSGHPGGVLALAFSPDGKTLASRGSDHTIRLADVATAKELKQIVLQPGGNPGGRPGGVVVNMGGQFGVQGAILAFSPDGKMLVTPGVGGGPNAWAPQANPAPLNPGPGAGNALKIYDVSTAKEIRKIDLPANRGVSNFAFSPDGRSLAAENTDKTITVYEVASGKERLQLGTAPKGPQQVMGAQGGVMLVGTGFGFGAPAGGPTVAFTPDGGKLVARNGSQVRVWDVVAGKELKQFPGHQGEVTTLGLARDGQTVASGSKDTTVLLWDISDLKVAPRSPVEVSTQQVETLWSELNSTDGTRAFKTIQALLSSPKQVAAFLKGQLKPVVPVEQKVIDKLIVDLESEDFAVRTKALEELEKLGELAVPSLNRVLAKDPPLETRKRAEELVGKLTGILLSGEQLRLVRAVEVLEQVGTPEARQVLEALVGGAPGALPTREARTALTRMTK